MSKVKISDAIIVLGGGRNEDGSLTELSRQRLNKSVELLKENLATNIIVPGGKDTTFLRESNFSETGAEVRERYVIKRFKELDIIANKINTIKVESGRDTITEAFAIREKARLYKFNKLILVTSDKHMRRALWIFKKIFGKKFSIKGISVPCGSLISEDMEEEFFQAVKRFFRKMPKEIPNPNLGTWFEDNKELYEEYRRIKAKYLSPNGREWQAYRGVTPECQPIQHQVLNR